MFLTQSEKRSGQIFLALAVLTISGVFSTRLLAQPQITEQPVPVQGSSAEVTSLCNPNKIESTSISGKTIFSCEGKRPSPRPGAASKYKDTSGRGARADIECSYSGSSDRSQWLGCNCVADEDSKCIGFIVWCATQGEEVSGNSASASCSPRH